MCRLKADDKTIAFDKLYFFKLNSMEMKVFVYVPIQGVHTYNTLCI